jgi:hypothetical protein
MNFVVESFPMACLLCLIGFCFSLTIPIKQEAGLLGYLSDIMSSNIDSVIKIISLGWWQLSKIFTIC